MPTHPKFHPKFHSHSLKVLFSLSKCFRPFSQSSIRSHKSAYSSIQNYRPSRPKFHTHAPTVSGHLTKVSSPFTQRFLPTYPKFQATHPKFNTHTPKVPWPRPTVPYAPSLKFVYPLTKNSSRPIKV